MAVDGHVQDHGLGEADLLRVDAHRIAFDDAGFFHAPDPVPAGGGGEAYLLAQFLQADAGILLQGFEDGQVEFVEFHFVKTLVFGWIF